MGKKRNRDVQEQEQQNNAGGETTMRRRPVKQPKPVSKDLDELTRACLSKTATGEEVAESDVMEMLFELANATEVVSGDIRIQQDLMPEVSHNGGIIWETSYVMTQFLIETLSSLQTKGAKKKAAKMRILELGAGCGYLGISLAQQFPQAKVVMTDQACTLANLQANVAANNKHGNLKARLLSWGDGGSADDGGSKWRRLKYDYVVGTDIIFNSQLVEPLLQELHRFSHGATSVWLLVHVRDERAHRLFLQRCPHYFASLQTPALRIRANGGFWQKCEAFCECLLFHLSEPRDL